MVVKRRCQLLLDETHLSHTADADSVLEPLMERCRFCICIITDHYCRKRWPILEYQHFLSREQNTARRCLLPILVDMDKNRFEERARGGMASGSVEWTAYEALMSLKVENGDFSGKGRIDNTSRWPAFNADILHEICQKVCRILKDAHDEVDNENTDEVENENTPSISHLTRFEGQPIGANFRGPGSRTYPYHAFVSHAGEDKELLAVPLKKTLEGDYELNIFLDEDSIRAGGEIPRAVYAALNFSRVGIFVLTKDFVSKEWPMRELQIFQYEYILSTTFGLRERVVIGIVPYKVIPAFLNDNPLTKWLMSFRACTYKDVKAQLGDLAANSNEGGDDNRLPQQALFASHAAHWIVQTEGIPDAKSSKQF